MSQSFKFLLNLIISISLILVNAPIVFAGEGYLDVTSRPEGVSIVIEGKVKGTTPTMVTLMPGSYEVTAKKENFTPETRRVTINDGEVKSLEFILQQGPAWEVEETIKENVVKGLGKLTVITDIRGATVEIDGNMVPKKTPFTLKNVQAGPHRITIYHNNRVVVDKTVNIQPNKTYTLKESLKRSSININTIPEGVGVSIMRAGKSNEMLSTEISPAEFVNLKPDKYSISIDSNIFQEVRFDVNLTNNFEKTIKLKEAASHRNERRKMIEQFQEVYNVYSEEYEKIAPQINMLQANLKPTVSSVPGKQFKSEESGDLPKYYQKECAPSGMMIYASCFVWPLLFIIPHYTGLPDKLTKDNVMNESKWIQQKADFHRKSFNTDIATYRLREDSGQIAANREYNRLLRAELNRLNRQIQEHNDNIESKITAIKSDLLPMENTMNALIRKISNNLSEIDKQVNVTWASNDYGAYLSAFKKIA